MRNVEVGGTSDFCKAEISPSPYNAEIMQILNTGERCSPLQLFGQVLPPQNRFALCVSTLRLGLERRCRFNTPISLLSDIWLLYAFDTTICTLSACAEWGSASYSARGFAPRPHKPSSAWLERALYLSLRSVLYFTLCLQFTLVCYAHFSFLTPHLNLPSDNFFTQNCVMFKLSL